MIINIPLQGKASTLDASKCNIVGVEYVPEATFQRLKRETLRDFPFLEKWSSKLGDNPDGTLNSLLVLNDRNDDGIVVHTSGYTYARNAAFLPGAKTLFAMYTYPCMEDFIHEMTSMVDRYAKLSVDCQLDGEFSLDHRDLEKTARFSYFNEGLFREMLSNRPEIEYVDLDYEGYSITVAPEFRTEIDESAYKVLSQEDVDIICAKHFLQAHDCSGELADFSNCLLKDIDLHGKELNGALLRGARFVNCNLSDCGLCFADMTDAFFCKAQVVYPNAQPYFAIVFIYEDLEDNAEIQYIASMTAYGELDENAGSAEQLDGGWAVTDVQDDGLVAFKKATEELVGVSYTPIRVLSSQVVAGMNYCVLCKAQVVAPNAEPYYTLAFVYEDLDGNAELTQFKDLDITMISTLAADTK